LPINLRSLVLTGGEPFASKSLLYSTLNYLMIRSLPDLKGIWIFTNGFWAKDKQSINQVIGEIKKISLIPVRLQIGSTRYHREFGSPLKTIRDFLKEGGQDRLVKIVTDRLA
jgi:hypothetical protein